jgi:hypothetical protein
MTRTIARLPIAWHQSSTDMHDHASRAMQVTAKVIRSIHDIFNFALVIEAGDDQPTTAWFEIEGFDADRTLSLTERIASLITGHSTWLGFEEAELVELREPDSYAFDLVPSTGVPLDAHHSWSPAVRVASTLSGRVTIRIALVDVITSAGEPSNAAMSITVSGTTPDAEIVADSLAQELSIERNFRPREIDASSRPPAVSLSMRECGRALSTVSRISGNVNWRDAPSMPFDEAIDRMRRSDAPILIAGKTGSGKGTLIEHLHDAALEDETLLCICMHGDLSHRLAARAQQRGVPFVAVGFDHRESAPTFNLLQSPDPSVPLKEWLCAVPEIIISPLKALGLTFEMAGPSWLYNCSAAIEVCATTGAGTILDTSALLSDADLSPELASAIDSLTDEDLRRRINQARRAVLRSSDGSFAVYQNSKLQFLNNPRMRAIFGTRTTSFSLAPLFDEGTNLYVSASTAELGEHGAAMVVTALLTAVYEIARRRPPDDRRRIRLLIPEAHRLCPILLRTLLAEGRKFGIVGTVLDMQTPSTLDRNALAGLLGNTGPVASFALGPVDAATLDGRYPTIPTSRLQQLPRYRMAVSFGDSDALVDTLPPIEGTEDRTAFEQAHRKAQAGQKPRRRRTPAPTTPRADPAAALSSRSAADDKRIIDAIFGRDGQ